MRKTLLICDDDEDILELCKTILEKDYDVVTANKIENIVDLVSNNNPSLVLMDIWIPLMGGDKATITLKNNKSTAEIPVVLFSANDEIEKICKQTMADGYIKKPFSVKILKDYIRDKTNG